MKQYLVIPLLFVYALAISGLTIHTHYCGKRLVAVNLSLKSDDPCNVGCNKKPMKCCKDKVVSLKVINEQKTVQHFSLKSFSNSLPPALLPGMANNVVALPVSVHANLYNPNAPPGLWQQIPLYQLYSSLVYYG